MSVWYWRLYVPHVYWVSVCARVSHVQTECENVTIYACGYAIYEFYACVRRSGVCAKATGVRVCVFNVHVACGSVECLQFARV